MLQHAEAFAENSERGTSFGTKKLGKVRRREKKESVAGNGSGLEMEDRESKRRKRCQRERRPDEIARLSTPTATAAESSMSVVALSRLTHNKKEKEGGMPFHGRGKIQLLLSRLFCWVSMSGGGQRSKEPRNATGRTASERRRRQTAPALPLSLSLSLHQTDPTITRAAPFFSTM